MISEIRSRGVGGATDEFIELYNPTSSPITLDSEWKIQGRKPTSATYTTRWTGTGKSIPAHGHFLIANSTGYTQLPAADEVLSSGVTDSTSVVLTFGGTTVDAVCYFATNTTAAAYDSTFLCEGTPVSNALHSDGSGAASDVDAGIERKPCTDTDDNAADFVATSPSTPQGSTSSPTP